MSVVSIVIPVWNKADTVERSIRSARAQSLKDIEIIVVNDGSTDTSEGAIFAACADDPRCEYVYQDNAGVAHARNAGVLNHSTSPFVMCLDADDAIEEHYLALLVPELLEDRSLGIVFTSLWYILPDGKEGMSQWPSGFDAEKQLSGQNQIPTAALTRRTVWERLGGQRQRYAPLGAGAEDGDFWLRAVSYGFGAKYVQPIEGSLFLYSWQSGIVSGNKDYREVDYRAWSPWTKDYHLMPTPSLAPPKHFSHAARQYDQPTVSIIIPVGPGHAKHLVNCLDSLDAQTYKKWEAIVVFDIDEKEHGHLWVRNYMRYISDTWPFCRFASTGSGPEVIRPDALEIAENRLAGQLDDSVLALARMKPASKPLGAGAARNIGIDLARGSMLLFLDADDWLVPSALSKMLKAYKESGNIIFTDHMAIANIPKEKLGQVDGEVVAYNERTGEAFINQKVGEYNCQRAQEQPYTDGRLPYVICSVTSLVPRKWVTALGGFNTVINSWEDVLLFWQLAWDGRCFTRVPEPLFVYRYGTGGRRERGRENARKLLEYLSELSMRTEKMGCGCSQDKGPQVYDTTTAGGGGMIQLNLSRGGVLQVSDNDLVLAEFAPPDRGGKMRYGSHSWPGGQIRYGHFAGGETFYVHVRDIEAENSLAKAQNRMPTFIPVQSPHEGITEAPDEVGSLEAPPEITEEALYEPVNHHMPPEYTERVRVATAAMATEDAASADDYFPEPVETKVVAENQTLDNIDLGTLRNQKKFIKILNDEGIHTPEDVLDFEEQDEFGLGALDGIGPKAKEAFLNGARAALGL